MAKEIKRKSANEPITLQIGGVNFIEVNYENGFTLAQNQHIAPIIAGMSDKDGAEIALTLDVASILACILLYEGETFWKKENYLKKKLHFENNEAPEEAGDLIANFFVFAPQLMQRFFQIYSKMANTPT